MENLNDNLINDQKFEQENGGEVFALAASPETESLTSGLENLHDALMDSQPFTAGAMADLRKSFEALTIDFFGLKVTLQELKDDPKFLENSKFFREILSGNFENVSSLTFILPSIVEALSNAEERVSLEGLGDDLPDFLIEALSKFKCEDLDLGITKLPDSLAKVLALYNGEVTCSSLQELSSEAAEIFSHSKGRLSLGRLDDISTQTLGNVAKIKGGLWFNGFEELSEEKAEILASHEGTLYLGFGEKSFSDQAIESLSHNKGDLYLDLNRLSPQVAESLSRHKGGRLFLESLRFLSDEEAKILTRHAGPIYFMMLSRSVSDEALRILIQSGQVNFSSGDVATRVMELKKQEAEAKTKAEEK